MKISRNDPCACGSGKKYKKCCLESDRNWEEDYESFDDLDLPLLNVTGEAMMFVRLYFKIQDLGKLKSQLEKLNCIEWYPEEDMFAIDYHKEAKKMDLPLKYKDVSPEVFPALLAWGCMEEKGVLYIDTGSTHKAIGIIHLLEKHILSETIQLTDVVTVNEFFHWTEDATTCASKEKVDEVFSKHHAQILEDIKNYNPDYHRLDAVRILESFSKPLPKVERISVPKIKDFVEFVEDNLAFRYVTVCANFAGDRTYTIYEAVLDTMQELEEEGDNLEEDLEEAA